MLVLEPKRSGGRLNKAHSDGVRACEDDGTVGKSNNTMRAQSEAEGDLNKAHGDGGTSLRGRRNCGKKDLSKNNQL